MQLNATMLRSSARALVCEHSEPRVTADTVIAVSQRRVRDEGRRPGHAWIEVVPIQQQRPVVPANVESAERSANRRMPKRLADFIQFLPKGIMYIDPIDAFLLLFS